MGTTKHTKNTRVFSRFSWFPRWTDFEKPFFCQIKWLGPNGSGGAGAKHELRERQLYPLRHRGPGRTCFCARHNLENTLTVMVHVHVEVPVHVRQRGCFRRGRRRSPAFLCVLFRHSFPFLIQAPFQPIPRIKRKRGKPYGLAPLSMVESQQIRNRSGCRTASAADRCADC